MKTPSGLKPHPIRTLLCTGLLLGISATFSRANSYVYVPLTVPKAADIVAFSNGLPPGTGSRRMLTRAQVLRFLTLGHNNTNPATWPESEIDSDGGHPCDGVIVGRTGQVYFWTLISRRGLRLETADGKTACLQLR